MRRKTLYLENPTQQQLYDAIRDASAMGFKKIIAHGHVFKQEFGVKKKIIKLG
jgi:hypothetical protein